MRRHSEAKFCIGIVKSGTAKALYSFDMHRLSSVSWRIGIVENSIAMKGDRWF